MKVKTIINYCNLPKHITCHVIGKEHSMTHRRCIGVIVAFCGVIIAKLCHLSSWLEIPGEVLGYSLHGLGAIPFFEPNEKKLIEEEIEYHHNINQNQN